MFILQMIATGYVLLVLYADFGDFLVDEQRGCEDCVDGRKEWVVYYILLLGDVLWWIIFFCNTLSYTLLYYTVIYCTILCYIQKLSNLMFWIIYYKKFGALCNPFIWLLQRAGGPIRPFWGPLIPLFSSSWCQNKHAWLIIKIGPNNIFGGNKQKFLNSTL